MADLPLRSADPALQSRLAHVIDREGKIPAALESLGPVADREVVLLDADAGLRASQLRSLGAHVRRLIGPTPLRVAPASADVLVSFWSGFQGATSDWDVQMAHAERVLRPGGRLLVVHDYGQDEVTGLLGDEARQRELVAWSRRDGWFLRHGFKVRTLHCWWTWASIDEAREMLTALFGDAGAAVADGMRRPRLAYKVAVYHRGVGGS